MFWKLRNLAPTVAAVLPGEVEAAYVAALGDGEKAGEQPALAASWATAGQARLERCERVVIRLGHLELL